MNAADEFSGLFADLVSDAQHEPVLAELLVLPAGAWVSLRSLCQRLPRIIEVLNRITTKKQSEPMITWLLDPLGPERLGYCLIIAYWEAESADSIALFNKALLEAKLASRRANLSLLS